MAARENEPVNPLSMTSDEMGEIIRGERPDPEHPANAMDESPAPREPDIVTEDEERPSAPSVKDATPAPRGQVTEEDDPLRKALATIDGLRRDQDELRRRLEERPSRGAEPQVELMEVMRGISIPKDPSQRLVQLTGEDLKSVGLDPAVAPGLEILANALVERFSQVYNPYVTREIDNRLKSRDDASKGTQSFFNAYPDLVGNEDLLEMVEMRARNQDRIHEHYRGEDYTREIAKLTRTRLASYRGQTLEEYEAALERPSSQTPRSAPSVSRATVTPTRRRASAPPVSNLQKELDELG